MNTPLQQVVERVRAMGVDMDEEKAATMLERQGRTAEEYLGILDESARWTKNYKPGKPPKDGQADKFLEPISYTIEKGHGKEDT